MSIILTESVPNPLGGCEPLGPISAKSGASRVSGLICGSWERRKPRPSRNALKITSAAS